MVLRLVFYTSEYITEEPDAVVPHVRICVGAVQVTGCPTTTEPKPEDLPEPQTASTSEESVALSKALKKMGWKFVGPTTVFAFMQAMGLINDHAEGCASRNKADAMRNRFTRPG